VEAVGTAVTKKDIQFDGTLLLSDGKVMVTGAAGRAVRRRPSWRS
jgi:hypothetical protein